jgi:hypothetical protein
VERVTARLVRRVEVRRVEQPGRVQDGAAGRVQDERGGGAGWAVNLFGASVITSAATGKAQGVLFHVDPAEVQRPTVDQRIASKFKGCKSGSLF